MEKRVDNFILVYRYTRKVCTLASLDCEIAAMFQKGNYAELQLGPLTTHRLVRETFKVSPTMVIPRLTEGEFYDLFWDFIRRSPRRRNDKRFDLSRFLVDLAIKKEVRSKDDLGIYIHSEDFFLGSFFKTMGDIGAKELAAKIAWQKRGNGAIDANVRAELEDAVAASKKAADEGDFLTEGVLDFLSAWRPLRAERRKETARHISLALQATLDPSTTRGNRLPSGAQRPPLALKSASAALAAFL